MLQLWMLQLLFPLFPSSLLLSSVPGSPSAKNGEAVEESYCHVSVLVLKSFLELKWREQLVELMHTKGKRLLSLENQF